MSRTIDATHTLDPSAGNDPSVNYKVAATDSVSPVALTMDQIANAVAVRIGSAPPPNPIEDLNQLVITLQPNQLTAVIQVVTGVAYTHYVVLLNDETEPDYPADFTEGAIPSLKSVAVDPDNPVASDWTENTCYVWVYDLPTTTKKEILPPGGSTDGVTIAPSDTRAPNPVTDLVLSAGDIDSTQFKYLFSSTTDGESGIAGYRLRNSADDTIFIDPAIPDTLTQVSNRTPGEEIGVYVEVYDNFNNSTNPETDATNTANITLGTTTASNAGIAAFSVINYEFDEDTNEATAVLERTVDSDGTLQVTVSTKDRNDAQGVALVKGGTPYSFGTTAEVSSGNDTIDLSGAAPGFADGTAITYDDGGGAVSIGLTNAETYYTYDAASNDLYTLHADQTDSLTGANPENLTASGAETQYILEGSQVGYHALVNTVYSWSTGVSTDIDVDVKLVNRGSLGNSFNNKFQIEIDFGSNTDGASNPVGAIGAIDAALVLVNSSVSGYTGFQEQNGTRLVSIETETSNKTVVADVDNATRTWSEVATARASGGKMMQPTNSGVNRGSATLVEENACYMRFLVAITGAGSNTWDIFTRAVRDSDTTADHVHIVLEHPIASIGADDSGTGGAGFRKVTTTEAHALTNSDSVALEGTDNDDATVTITDASGVIFDIPNNAEIAQATAGGVAIGLTNAAIKTSPYYSSSACMAATANYSFNWSHWDASCNDVEIVIPAPGSWAIRAYQYDYGYKFDKIIIALDSEAYDPTSDGDVGINPADDYMGKVASTYNVGGGVATDNPDNPEDPDDPNPIGTVTAPVLTPANLSEDVSTSQQIRATFATNVTDIVMQSMTVTTGGNPISGSPVVNDNIVDFNKGAATLAKDSTYVVNGSGVCNEAGVPKNVAFGPWSFSTTPGVITDPDIILAVDFENNAVSSRTKLTTSQFIAITGATSASFDDMWLRPDPDGVKGTVIEQHFDQNEGEFGANNRFTLNPRSTTIASSQDMKFIGPWGIDGPAKVVPGCRNSPLNVFSNVLQEKNKCSFSIQAIPGTGGLRLQSYYYHHEGNTQYGRTGAFWNSVDPTENPNSSQYVYLPIDRWFNVRWQATTNDIGFTNGILKCWLDGKLVFSRTDVSWTQDLTGTTDDGNTVWSTDTREWMSVSVFGSYLGGGNTHATYEQSHIMDNLEIRTTAFGRAPIEPFPANSRYWQYKGSPTLLLGAFPGAHNVFLYPDQVALGGDLTALMNEMVAAGGNYMRCVVDPGRSVRDGFPSPFSGTPGSYDLTSFTSGASSFWGKFETMLIEASARDIILEIEFWSPHDWEDSEWDNSPWNPDNNSNYTTGSSGLANSYSTYTNHPFSQTAPLDPDYNGATSDVVRGFQDAYIEHMLSISLPYDNVLYCMSNETKANIEWGEYWIAKVNAEAATAGKTVYVSDMYDDGFDIENSTIYDAMFADATFTYCNISQINQVKTVGGAEGHWDGLDHTFTATAATVRPINNTKVYGADTKPTLGSDTREGDYAGINSYWMDIIGGCASIRFHRPTSGLGLSTAAKASMTAARLLQSKVDLWDMTADFSHSLLTGRATVSDSGYTYGEAFLSYQAGQQYAIYFTEGGAVGLNLTSYSGVTFDVDWIDIDSGIAGTSTTQAGGGTPTFTAPDNGSWVVAIVRQ